MKSSPKANQTHIKSSWEKLKGKVEVGASYCASADNLATRVIAGLDDIGDSIENRIDQTKQNIYRNAAELADSNFDYAVESAKSVLIDTAKYAIDKFLAGRPRLQ